MARKSVMVHQFSMLPKADIPRSHFDRSHGYKTTFDAGYLVPIFIDEVLPGDTFNLKAHLCLLEWLLRFIRSWIICFLIRFGFLFRIV